MKRMRIDEWFFLGFLFTYTLSIRKVLYFVPIRGNFNEYTGSYLYLSDLFIVATLVCWARYLLLKHKKEEKSICYENDKVNVPRGTYRLTEIIFKNNSQVIHSFVKYLCIGLIAYSFLSIMWSNAHTIALYRAIKLLEFVLVFVYLLKNVPRETFFKRILWITIIIGALNSVIGILQIIFQHSVGISWLWESYLNINVDGVAKVILGNSKVLRAYGLFPHPNIFGGFLVMSITFNLILLKMFHVEHKMKEKRQKNTAKCSTWNKIINKSKDICKKCSTWNNMLLDYTKMVQNVSRGTLLSLILFFQSIGLIITFSKSAWTAMIIVLIFIFVRNVPRGTKIDVSFISKKLILLVLIVIMALISLKYNIKENLSKSIDDRIGFINVSRGTISNNLWFGVGVGQSVVNMAGDNDLKNWQFQPVHNVFLLIFQEFGLIGSFILTCLIVLMFHVEHSRRQETVMYFKALMLAFIFIMFFDHYFWDIQQGQLMLVIIASLLEE